MKKYFQIAICMLCYIITTDVFAYDLIQAGKWNVLSWTTFWAALAAASMITLGWLLDKKD